jgi:class 3 adenylate cyclase
MHRTEETAEVGQEWSGVSARARNEKSIDISLLPIFDGVSADLLDLIKPDEMVCFYEDDEIILRQDEEARCLIILLRGQVRVVADDVYLVTRQPYDIVGEQAFIGERPHTAAVIAQGLVKAIVLPRAVVERLMKDTAFVRNLLRVVSQKLTEATNERSYRFQIERLLFEEFRAHLSPAVMQRLLATGRDYGAPRYIDAVILFSDIRSFTERSAGMRPEDIAAELSPYLDAVVDVIHRHEGLVDKFIGDAVMAIWGFAPSGEDPVEQAFACAREMVGVAAAMTFGGASIQIGVGLNAGPVFIGNVGGKGKRQFTVLGSPVNLAARFESESKVLDAPVVVGSAFYERLPQSTREQFVVHRDHLIKGAEPQTVFTFDPIGNVSEGKAVA